MLVLFQFLLSLSVAAVPTAPIDHLSKLNSESRWTEMERVGSRYMAEARGQGDWTTAGRLQYYICRAMFQRGQYARALQSAITGRDYSLRAKDFTGAAYNSFGIAMVHLATDSFELGVEAGQQMLDYARQARTDPAMFAILQAVLLQGSERPQEAIAVLRETLSGAERTGNWMVHAESLGRIGSILLAQSTEQAEPYLVEAFRITKLLYPKGLPTAYTKLARLRLAQNRPREAIGLAEEALRHPSEQVRRSNVYETIGRAYLKLGRNREALAAFRKAVETERARFAKLPFADELQVSHENSIQSYFELFALTAAELNEHHREESIAIEAFEVVQENRAASLRNRASADEAWRDRLPDSYWLTLAKLRRIASSNAQPTFESQQTVRRLRANLIEVESAAGLPGELRSSYRATVRQLQARLSPGEVVIGFLLADPHSLRWVIRGDSIRMERIASKGRITAAAARFRREVQDNDPAHRASGAELAGLLFSGLPARGSWTIIPDDILFTIPFAALSLPAARGAYLAETLPLRLAPTAGFLDQPRTHPLDSFLGIGDPVTNRADPRIPGRIGAGATPDLPRLAGSAEELRRCSRLWPQHRLLLGPLNGVEAMRSALATQPRVLHLATHVYVPAARQPPAIALGYTPAGEWNVLTGREIVALGPAPELVTLSGCGSGRGPLAPGSGLLGLTRAWLMAGSAAVMATLWEVPDGGGELLEDYYQRMLGIRGLGTSRKAAYALQKAQLHAILKTPPSIWAAYFIIGAI